MNFKIKHPKYIYSNCFLFLPNIHSLVCLQFIKNTITFCNVKFNWRIFNVRVYLYLLYYSNYLIRFTVQMYTHIKVINKNYVCFCNNSFFTNYILTINNNLNTWFFPTIMTKRYEVKLCVLLGFLPVETKYITIITRVIVN